MSTRDIAAKELLDLADVLAGRSAGRGRPKTIHLRRAISTAYYALFHEIVRQGAEMLVPGTSPQNKSRRNAATRWIGHSDLRKLADDMGKETGPLRSVVGAVHKDLKHLTSTFAHLQEQRERADYAHDFEIDKPGALAVVDRAKDAMKRARNLRQEGDPSHLMFLKLMIGAVKIARNRN